MTYPVFAQGLYFLSMFLMWIGSAIYFIKNPGQINLEARRLRLWLVFPLAIVLTGLGAIVWGVSYFIEDPPAHDIIMMMLIGTIVMHGFFALMATPLVSYLPNDRRPPLRAFLGLLAVLFVWNALFGFLMHTVEAETQDGFGLKDVGPGAPIQLLTVLCVVIVAAMLEEVIFRGGIQTLLIKLLGSPLAAMIVTSVVFAVGHSAYITPHGLKELHTFVMSLIFGYACYHYGLLTAVALHVINNGVSVALVFFLPTA